MNFNFMPVTREEIIRVIKNISSLGANSADGIGSRMLKLSTDANFAPMANIFNHSIKTSKYPSLWKFSLVTPTHKDGNAHDLSHYRKISILPAVSKVFERILIQQLRFYLEDNKLINAHQHGFRGNQSFQTALLSLSNRLFAARDLKNYSIISIIDFSQAFDTLNHVILVR